MEQNYIIVIGLLFAFYFYRIITGVLKNGKLKNLMDSGEDFILIDVRTPSEFAGGHIPGARNIPVDALAGKLGGIGKDKPVVVYCQSGSRSGAALVTLKSKGYTLAWNFGSIGRWKGKLER